MRVRIIVVLAILLLPSQSHADFATRVKEGDTQVALMKEGFSRSEIEAIKLTARAYTIQKVCGEEYVSDRLLAFILKTHIGETGIPSEIFLSKIVRYGSIQASALAANGAEALSFCRSQRELTKVK